MKYNVRICNCGRIHAIPEIKINEAIEHDKDLLMICGGCGKSTLIGADIDTDPDDEQSLIYNMYSKDFRDGRTTSITLDMFIGSNETKGIDAVLIDEGYKVPMKTGNYATDFYNDQFSEHSDPEFCMLQKPDITYPIMQFIQNYDELRTTVDMTRLVREIPDDVLQDLKCYYIAAFKFD